jgi:hypothetical protein
MIERDRSNHYGIRNSVEEKQREHKRIVKLGDPTTKVVEFAEKLNLYMLTMDPTEVMETSTMEACK